MKQIIFDHWILIVAVVFLIALVVKERRMMKKNIRESENYIDRWWDEHSEMFIDADGNLYMVFDKKEVYYPMEEKLF